MTTPPDARSRETVPRSSVRPSTKYSNADFSEFSPHFRYSSMMTASFTPLCRLLVSSTLFQSWLASENPQCRSAPPMPHCLNCLMDYLLTESPDERQGNRREKISTHRATLAQVAWAPAGCKTIILHRGVAENRQARVSRELASTARAGSSPAVPIAGVTPRCREHFSTHRCGKGLMPLRRHKTLSLLLF